ncbi:calmodulin-binding transcription activator 3-like isoform X1 [Ananas comosus]|uniref:Calmodulin-binding transcription activator 3-like isoform X1 n=2 Tax=Ananas comosus TaxID=4615 RepID=A0A6P5F562_ANACO|nr:calmodulin-binding transcription activator 3-like isoform X1 [Ananas comosus]XP_020088400.1 calmodulin-binding transcription activator 3-like isoform X1 [Ananas comosus]
MADARRYALTPQLDIEQILLEAQHRWLRPAEICEILRNYRKFRIAPEPPNRPPSGSLFLFDRKVLRYFRKDGHNWRKKKDGKTVKEAHERLKAGSVDVLHCYYAHGEENENFQRRSYWMLEEEFMHIVLVHYREVKGGRPNFSRSREVEEVAQVSHTDSPACSNSFTSQSHIPSQTTDAESPNSGQTSEYEDAESDNYPTSSRYNPIPEMRQYEDGRGHVMDAPLLNPYVSIPSVNNQSLPGDYQGIQPTTPPISDYYSVAQEDTTTVFDGTGGGLTFSGSKTTQLELASWDEVLAHCTTGFQTPYVQPSVGSRQATAFEDNSSLETITFGEAYNNDLLPKEVYGIGAEGKLLWQHPSPASGSLGIDGEYGRSIEENIGHSPLTKQASLDLSHLEADGLKKYDSFSRWMSKELEEVDDSQLRSNSEPYWNTVDDESVVESSNISNHEPLDSYAVSPSLSQDQLFSIIDFSPSWAFASLETKVLITGTFLKNEDIDKCKWSCMFGEVEVPVEVLADGTLRCYAPPHKPGRVPFYVTCSNRLACSEVREFEFRSTDAHYMETSDSSISSINDMHLHIRLEKLLTLGPVDQQKGVSNVTKEKIDLNNKVSALMMDDDEWSSLLKVTDEKEVSIEQAKDQLAEKLIKEKLHSWLIMKIYEEEGKGPNILGKEGQGVIHLTAALGYDWAIRPIIVAGVNVNYRDVHGWTALHWAAFCGRERTVVALIAMGAAPGALTDPTPEFPAGRTPADLASANGHKGIAGFLAESSLTSHLNALTLKDSKGSDVAEICGLPSLEDVPGKVPCQLSEGDDGQGGSLKDSLSAVRNASQAAARIYQVFRVQSFHRKKLVEYGDEKCGVSDERALSLISVKSAKPGQHDMPLQSAAIRIQNKFRGWKGRKEFLLIRQRIVKIQAHVRGHQVRKQYRKIVWSVGIVEKAILRWRRKGCGLRGFRPEGLIEGPSMQIQAAKTDDYDFLQEGRRQSEARLQTALARVKSMVQYPEARDQYRRLLTVVTELQESKAAQDKLLSDIEGAADGDFMVELEQLWQDDTPMPSI